MFYLMLLLQVTNLDMTPVGNIEHADQRMTQACQTAALLESKLNNRCLCVQRMMRIQKDPIAYPIMAEMAAEILFKGRARTNIGVVAEKLKAYHIDLNRAKTPEIDRKLAAAMNPCRN